YLIAQDINQLYAHYGRDEAITSTCHVQCAFAPNRIETAEHLSKLTGQTTVVKEQVTNERTRLVNQCEPFNARSIASPAHSRLSHAHEKRAQECARDDPRIVAYSHL